MGGALFAENMHYPDGQYDDWDAENENEDMGYLMRAADQLRQGLLTHCLYELSSVENFYGYGDAYQLAKNIHMGEEERDNLWWTYGLNKDEFYNQLYNLYGYFEAHGV